MSLYSYSKDHGSTSESPYGLTPYQLLAYWLCVSINRIWFHPLSKFPGPRLYSILSFPHLYYNYVKGTWVRNMPQLHQEYGPIVRIGPNHLSLDGSVAWPQVFAHRGGGKAEFEKLPDFFYPDHGLSIISAPREVHRRMRRQMGHAFSDAALIEQESIITSYVDLLMKRLNERVEESQTFNIIDLFNFTTFDIIGDLVFADPFHSLKNNDYHPWVLSIFNGVRGNAFNRFCRAYPPLRFFTERFTLRDFGTSLETRQLARSKAMARMELGAEPRDGRRDFMTYMMRKTRDGEQGMSDTEILANSPTLVVAGSETTATALSGLFFFLSTNPEAYNALMAEIRSSFANQEDITMRSTATLEYLHACIEETLRMYPPVAEVPPRVSPGDFIDGKFVPAGTRISVYQWVTFRSPANFTDPDCFRPERWLGPTHPRHDAKFVNDNKSAFKPFSHGSRDCIGKNLAYAEMRLIISRILYQFDYAIAQGQSNWQREQRAFMIWDKGPLRVNLMLRKNHQSLSSYI
ncbi:cytochrome p450 3a17 [Trichoderma arundinaceum]|uniref:Cytochrome p450 3a17 n=1 Tax=Trichoderma arundinaceum TaxID=490622 RepID=A0A395NVE0_TRIAR|nr:cytochrome p450 3a17 [Trichoderma arundinaceum]